MNSSLIQSSLPFWETLGRAYGQVFRNLGRLFLLVYLPFLLSVMALGVVVFIIDWDRDLSLLGAAMFLGSVLVSSAIFAVAWHRFLLLGWESHAAGARVRFGKREATYVGLLCLACVPLWTGLAVITSPLSNSPGPTLVVVSLCLIATCLLPRFAMLLPASALEQSLSARASWSQTRGIAFTLTLLLLIPTLVYIGLLSIPAWVPGGGVQLFVSLLIPYFAVHFIMWVAVLTTVLSVAFARQATTIVAPAARRSDEVDAHDDGDILILNADRDFGWLYIGVSSPGIATVPWLAWFFWGWPGAVAAILPSLVFVRVLLYRAVVLMEDTAIEVDRETLRLRGRFDEVTVYLKDIREVTLRRTFGSTSVCLTFDDLDRAFAHTVIVQNQTPTFAYAMFLRLFRVLGYVDVWTTLVRVLKGDFPDTFLGQRVDLYKQGEEQYLKDMSRDAFEKYGFHWMIQPIFRNLSNVDLARAIDHRRQAAKMRSPT